MIIKLLPDQVMNYWPMIKGGIEASLPPVTGDSKEKMNNILIELLDGRLDCWIAFRKDIEVDVVAIIITSISYDSRGDTSSLLLYCVYALKQTEGQDWVEGYEALSKYARANNCSRMVAYSNDEKILKIVEKFGGDASYRFLSIPI